MALNGTPEPTPDPLPDSLPDLAAGPEVDPVVDPLADGPLARALGAARAEEAPDWPGLATSIRDRVQDLSGPGAPIRVHDDAGHPEHDAAGSRTFVSTRVLTGLLRRRLQQPTHAPHDLDLVLDGDRLAGVHVELVATYGPDLLALGEQVRGEIEADVVALLGPDPDFDASRDVSIRIVDVVSGDPTA